MSVEQSIAQTKNASSEYQQADICLRTISMCNEFVGRPDVDLAAKRDLRNLRDTATIKLHKLIADS